MESLRIRTTVTRDKVSRTWAVSAYWREPGAHWGEPVAVEYFITENEARANVGAVMTRACPH